MAAYKLKDLIKWGLADTRIYLETGIKLDDLEEQLELRGQLDEFEVLKELRRPELIELIDSWPGQREDYNAGDVIEDIEKRAPVRKLLVQVDKSRNHINRSEAELIVQELKGGTWERVPSAMPGFLVANNQAEMTLEEEIKRTAQFLDKKYFPDLVEKPINAERYKFSGARIGTEEVEVTVNKVPGKKYESAQQYWAEISPKILNEKTEHSRKKLILIEFMRNLTNHYHSQKGDINLARIQKTVHVLKDMLDKAMEDSDKPETILQSIVTNPYALKTIYAHETSGKFAEGKGLRLNITKN